MRVRSNFLLLVSILGLLCEAFFLGHLCLAPLRAAILALGILHRFLRVNFLLPLNFLHFPILHLSLTSVAIGLLVLFLLRSALALALALLLLVGSLLARAESQLIPTTEDLAV